VGQDLPFLRTPSRNFALVSLRVAEAQILVRRRIRHAWGLEVLAQLSVVLADQVRLRGDRVQGLRNSLRGDLTQRGGPG